MSYTPQQNGVAERKNRSLKEMATCMLQSKSLPQRLWDEAIKCVAYIQNRVPHKSVKGVTPFEAWTGKKPEVTHFRVFGSRAWAHIPTEKWRALEPQSKECIFVGYPDDVKGYRLLDPFTNQLFVERIVKFDEGPPHAASDDPAEEPSVATSGGVSDTHSRNSEDDLEQVYSSDSEVEE